MEDKVLASIDRLARVLDFMLRRRAFELGLTLLQARILLYVKEHPSRMCTVGNISAEFGIAQPTVSDAVSALVQKGLLAKEPGGGRRTTILRLTEKGEQVYSKLADFKRPLTDAMAALEVDKGALLELLIRLMAELYEQGVMATARVCPTCRYFTTGGRPYCCQLLNMYMGPRDLRVDCPDHQPKDRPAPGHAPNP